jgi:hypothetical protein
MVYLTPINRCKIRFFRTGGFCYNYDSNFDFVFVAYRSKKFANSSYSHVTRPSRRVANTRGIFFDCWHPQINATILNEKKNNWKTLLRVLQVLSKPPSRETVLRNTSVISLMVFVWIFTLKIIFKKQDDYKGFREQQSAIN